MAAESDLFQKFGQHVDAGKVIFREGEDGEQMYIIQQGKVKVSRDLEGKEQILAILSKGDFFGEMAIVNKVKRTATVTALEPTRLLAFNQKGFLNMITKNARIALNVIDKLCRRLQHANLHIRHLARKDARSLVAMNLRYAFQGAGKDQNRLPLDRTADEFSANLELPMDTVRAYLGELQNQGIITIEGNTVTLQEPRKLAELAEDLGG